MWVVIFVGVALGLSPTLSGAVSIASAVVEVTLVVVAGERLQGRISAAAGLPSAALA